MRAMHQVISQLVPSGILLVHHATRIPVTTLHKFRERSVLPVRYRCRLHRCLFEDRSRLEIRQMLEDNGW